LHWNGTAWRRVNPGPRERRDAPGVDAVSGRGAWAVGCSRTFGNIKARPLVLHWTGIPWN